MNTTTRTPPPPAQLARGIAVETPTDRPLIVGGVGQRLVLLFRDDLIAFAKAKSAQSTQRGVG